MSWQKEVKEIAQLIQLEVQPSLLMSRPGSPEHDQLRESIVELIEDQDPNIQQLVLISFDNDSLFTDEPVSDAIESLEENRQLSNRFGDQSIASGYQKMPKADLETREGEGSKEWDDEHDFQLNP